MCELARNSVLQSGWEMEIKRHWLGPDFFLPGPRGNVVAKSNVPDIRLRFREETLREELDLIWRHGHVVDPNNINNNTSTSSEAPKISSNVSDAGSTVVDEALDPATFPGVYRLADKGKLRRASQHKEEGRPKGLTMSSE